MSKTAPRSLDTGYPGGMSHRVIKLALERLSVPAMIVTTLDGHEILATCPLTRSVVSANLLEGSNYSKVLKELGYEQLEDSAFFAVIQGEDMAVRLVHLHGKMNEPAWCVASRVPDVQGWPPCALVTIHADDDSEAATGHHVRDRMAVEMAILIEGLMFDTHTLMTMAQAQYRSVQQAAGVFVERLALTSGVRPTDPPS